MNEHKQGVVDVSAKKVTKRKAVHSSTLILGSKAYKALQDERSPKGNVLEAAKIAAIMAVKNTAVIIPMCHPLAINQVVVDFLYNDQDNSVTSVVEVSSEGKTGVEMEALLGASVSSLTIYDMMKWVSHDMLIQETSLDVKTGGASGAYRKRKVKT